MCSKCNWKGWMALVAAVASGVMGVTYGFFLLLVSDARGKNCTAWSHAGELCQLSVPFHLCLGVCQPESPALER